MDHHDINIPRTHEGVFTPAQYQQLLNQIVQYQKIIETLNQTPNSFYNQNTYRNIFENGSTPYTFNKKLELKRLKKKPAKALNKQLKNNYDQQNFFDPNVPCILDKTANNLILNSNYNLGFLVNSTHIMPPPSYENSMKTKKSQIQSLANPYPLQSFTYQQPVPEINLNDYIEPCNRYPINTNNIYSSKYNKTSSKNALTPYILNATNSTSRNPNTMRVLQGDTFYNVRNLDYFKNRQCDRFSSAKTSLSSIQELNCQSVPVLSNSSLKQNDQQTDNIIESCEAFDVSNEFDAGDLLIIEDVEKIQEVALDDEENSESFLNVPKSYNATLKPRKVKDIPSMGYYTEQNFSGLEYQPQQSQQELKIEGIKNVVLTNADSLSVDNVKSYESQDLHKKIVDLLEELERDYPIEGICKVTINEKEEIIENLFDVPKTCNKTLKKENSVSLPPLISRKAGPIPSMEYNTERDFSGLDYQTQQIKQKLKTKGINNAELNNTDFLSVDDLKSHIKREKICHLFCDYCGKEAIYLCNCFLMSYCSAVCQIKHWPEHKSICEEILQKQKINN